MRKRLIFAVCLSLSLMIFSCASSGTKVSRVHEDTTMDLSGRWNDTDSRLVADEMITDALNQRWIQRWESENKVPTVIVGRVVNKSHEHINVETFTRNIERALLNSGRVEFVASRSDRQQIRDERDDQQEFASFETRTELNQEAGAELMMTGAINAIVDREGKRSVIFYQVNMELVNMQTNQKVWIGEKQIKKYVERASARL